MEQLFDIENRSLRSLEWDRLLHYLAKEAGSQFAKEKCLAVETSSDIEEARRLLEETDEALFMFTNRAALLADVIPDLREIVALVAAQATLAPHDLLAIKVMLGITKSVKTSLSLLQNDFSHYSQSAQSAKSSQSSRSSQTSESSESPESAQSSFPRLSSYLPRLHPTDELRREIERCIDDQGGFKDEASSELRNLRQSLRKLHTDIRNELNRLIHSSTVSKALQEPIYTQRSGRYVLPVDVAKRGTVDGIVHDSSQSGLTVYVEPLSVVEPTNRIRIKEGEVEREIERLTSELCRLAHHHIAEITESFHALTDIDVIMARARLARVYKGVCPVLDAGDKLHLIGASHPLLLLQKVPNVVCNDVELGGSERSLVITGPNTGGKTVLLKQIGLMALMVRAGLLLPAKLGSVIPVFNKVWADIGDEQSLTQSLSTFSSHMQNIVEVVEKAGKGTLILLDEIGVGTDPKEGAALARSVLEHLNQSGAITVTTTHYGELKMLAYSEPGFVNGSLEFDDNTLTPTYRLRLGVAGSSKGTTIALRLGLDADVVDRAQHLLMGREEELSQAMAELERRTQLLNERESLIHQKETVLLEASAELAKTREQISDELEKKRLTYVSELESQFQSTAEEIKKMTRELQANPSLKSAQQAREKMETIRQELGWLEPASAHEIAGNNEKVSEGQEVKVLSLNQIGVVEALVTGEGQKVVATVRLGNMRVKVSVDELRPYRRQIQKGKPGSQRRTAKSTTFEKTQDRSLDAFIRTSSNTLDLRGERVDAALEKIDSFLDTVSLDGTSPVMIIHGHGTGAVKSAVREYLRASRYIKSFKPGELYEGGDGVTIVTMK